ncbi:5875_t:CDS:2 [Paraglomus occultum]|uniref:5875_t:CDS:1 n=1 Tax=Paraglomus occultum TaxID=144539 RepID=A0A9N9AQZ4_9GLOM|nr:5875_t:CDS:2 [Paraglomus occultum]
MVDSNLLSPISAHDSRGRSGFHSRSRSVSGDRRSRPGHRRSMTHTSSPCTRRTKITDGNVKIVFGIDFGSTSTGFAFCNVLTPNIITSFDSWPHRRGSYKTPSALLYDDNLDKLLAWGAPALAVRPARLRATDKEYGEDVWNKNYNKPIVNFRSSICHGGKGEDKLNLPYGLNSETVFTDHLRQITKTIEKSLDFRWPGISLHEEAAIIMVVPNNADRILIRKCAAEAGLISDAQDGFLEFVTESVAGALYCQSLVSYHNLKPKTEFFLLNCGGTSSTLSTCSIDENHNVSTATDVLTLPIGSINVDREFIAFLSRKLGSDAIQILQEQYDGQLQYLLLYFFDRLKTYFTGNAETYEPLGLDLKEFCPAVCDHIQADRRLFLEEDDWMLNIQYDDVKSFFDSVTKKLCQDINSQVLLNKSPHKVLFLIGGFAESEYFVNSMRDALHQFSLLAVPNQPITAASRGAVQFGLKITRTYARVLSHTYGIQVIRPQKVDDAAREIDANGNVTAFYPIVQRGTEVPVGRKFTKNIHEHRKNMNQQVEYKVYRTTKYVGKYCDEEGMELVGTVKVSGVQHPKKVEFSLTFEKLVVVAAAAAKEWTKDYCTEFEVEL